MGARELCAMFQIAGAGKDHGQPTASGACVWAWCQSTEDSGATTNHTACEMSVSQTGRLVVPS